MMQNLTTITALLAWPAVALALFYTLPLNKAILWTILGAQLLLPVGANLKLPIVPPLDKSTVPSICVLVGCLLAARRHTPAFRFGAVEVLVIIFLAGPFVTSALNSDPIDRGDLILPGVGIYDAGSTSALAFITLIPFFMGRLFFNRLEDSIELLQAVVFAMSIYSLLLLFEVRFSPQLHVWVYGYAPSDFVQAVRDGGFRPMAFMGHGLIAAHFVLVALLSSTILWRIRLQIWGFAARIWSAYLFIVLILCRTASATVYAIGLMPAILFLRAKSQMRLSIVLTMVALLYPTLRSFDVFPTETLVSVAATVSDDRARSLKYRFDNEDILLHHAFERPFFGWGRYGRSRVYNADTGRDLSVTDGEWIISIGQFGLFGFVAQFGLLSFGVFQAAFALKRAQNARQQICLASLSLLLTVSILDLLPNSGLGPWTWLLAGCLLGASERLLREPNTLLKRTARRHHVSATRNTAQAAAQQ